MVLYAILKRGALLPIAPVVRRLTMQAIAVWFKDTPVGSPAICLLSGSSRNCWVEIEQVVRA